MSEKNFTTNEPGPWQVVNKERIHVAAHGTFGGGSLALEQQINDNVYPVLSDGVAITMAVDTDIPIKLVPGDRVRLNLSGATSPDLDTNIAGAGEDRG